MIRMFLLLTSLWIASNAMGETAAPVTPPPVPSQNAMALLLDYKKSMQIHYESRLAEVISAIVGSSNAEVRVNVDVTAANTEETISDFDPEKSMITSEKSGDVRSETVEYETKKMITKRTAPFGSVRNISVALLIDDKFFSDMTETEKTEIMTRLEDIIRKTIGFDAARGDSIAIHPTKLMPRKGDYISPVFEDNSYLYYSYLAFGLLIFAIGAMLYVYFSRNLNKGIEADVTPIAELDGGEFPGDLQQKLKYFARHHPDKTLTALRKILRS